MLTRNHVVWALGIFMPCAGVAADPVWQNANYFTSTSASGMAESPSDLMMDTQGGNYSGLFPPRDDTYSVTITLPGEGGESRAVSTLRYSFIGNTLSIFGSVSADVDPGDFMIGGSADSVSSLTVQFDLPSGGTYRVIDGSFGGTHAGSSGTLLAGDAIFSFDSNGNQPNQESGSLPPGGYSLELSASASSNYLFFNGLFADASYYLDIEIIAAGSCTGDLNNDQLVDDADFAIFVTAYNLLDCADPGMPPGCPGDLNQDGVVDVADFAIFVPAYNELVCP